MATVADVQAKIDAGMTALSNTNKTYPQMVKTYGADWKKWPTGTQWYIALSNFDAAKTEVGQLAGLAASFTYKEQ